MKLNKKGVSLPELLAVIVIMGLIAAISIPAFSSMIKNSKKDKTLSEAKQLHSKIVATLTAEDITEIGNINDAHMEDITGDYNGKVPFFGDAATLRGAISFTTEGKAEVDFNGYTEFDFGNTDCTVQTGVITTTNIDNFVRACIK